MYHPLHLLLYRFLPLDLAFNLELLLCYPALFLGTALFLRGRGVERDAALFGGFLFAFGGFNILHYVHINAIAVVAHVPWLLWWIDRMASGQDRQATAWVALLTGSQLLLGYPQYVGFSLLVEGLFALWLCRESGRIGWLVGLVLAKLFGLLAGAIQVLPTRDVLAGSWRAAPTPEFLGLFSLHPANLLQWVAPYLSETRVVAPAEAIGGGATLPPADSIFDGRVKEFGLYNGSIVPSLLAWLAIRRGGVGDRGRLAIAAVVLAVLALILALGRFTPWFAILCQVPAINRFRGPARSIVLLNLATSVLAALAFADLSARRVRQDRPSWRSLGLLLVAPLLSLAVVVAAIWLVPRWPSAPISGSWAIASGPLLASSAAMLVAMAARGSRLALGGIILFTAIDLGTYGLSFVRLGDRQDLSTLAFQHPRPPTAPGERVEFSPSAPYLDNYWMFTGQGLVSGYVALPPLRRLDYSKPSSLRVASARWLLDPAPSPLADPLPRARLVTAAWPSADPNADLDRIDPAQIALIDAPLLYPLPGGPPGQAVLKQDDPGDIRLTTDAPTRQLLVLSERFDEGWQVTRNGERRRVIQVYGDFLGCLVEPGRQEIRFQFRPRSLIFGAWLSAIGGILISAHWLFSIHCARTRTPKPEHRSQKRSTGNGETPDWYHPERSEGSPTGLSTVRDPSLRSG